MSLLISERSLTAGLPVVLMAGSLTGDLAGYAALPDVSVIVRFEQPQALRSRKD